MKWRRSGTDASNAALYEISVKGKARKAIERLPRGPHERVIEAIENLANDPRPRGARKMRGTGDVEEWRVRISDYRVDDEARQVLVLAAGHRGSVYG